MMFNENFDQWLNNYNLSNKNAAFSSLGEWQKTMFDMFCRSNNKYLELLGDNYSQFSDQLKCLSHIKKPEELLELQKKILNEMMAASVENTQHLMQILMANIEECTHLCSKARDKSLSSMKSATGRKK